MPSVSVPTAIASGKGAESALTVSPLRAGVIVGFVTALMLLAVFVAAPLPGRVLALLGAPSEGVDRYGGLRMEWAPPPGEDLAVIERTLVERGQGANVRRAGDVLVFESPGVARELVEDLANQIGSGLTFHVVVQAPEMTELVHVLGLEMKGARPVDFEIDQWRSDEGELQIDYYLAAERWEDLDAAFARASGLGWRLPAGTRLAYEYLERAAGDVERPTYYWRSYVIEAQAELDGRRIADAIPSYDPNTNRPIVLLDFDEEGSARFAELTSRIVGKKLATVLGELVVSAPIINGPIYGGRASITMGGSDPQRQEFERDMLVSTLRAGALPPGGTVRSARYVEPSLGQDVVWLARLVIALGGGAIAGLAGWALVRATRPVRCREPARFAGGVPWRRLSITLLAPISLVVLRLVEVPGLSLELSDMLILAGQELHFASLGVSSVLTAYVLVELAALAVPGWRRRRFSAPSARLPLFYATVVVAFGLAVFQAWNLAWYLQAVMDWSGTGPWLVIGNLAVGTLALANVAELIRRFGVGNGYAALLVAELVISLIEARDAITAKELLAGGGVLLAGGVATAALVRWRIARAGEAPLRLPTSGIAPLAQVFALVGIFVIAVAPLGWFAEVSAWFAAHPEPGLAIALAMTAVWSFAFARPSLVQRLASRVALAPPAWSTWAAATALSAGALALIGAPYVLLAVARPEGPALVTAAGGALATAWLLDVILDLRRGRGALVRVWSLHHAQHLELAREALARAGLAVHASGAHLRVLLAWFGPWAPIDLYVRPDDAEVARQTLESLFADG